MQVGGVPLLEGFESQVLLVQTSKSSSGDFRNYVPATNVAGAKLPSLLLPTFQLESLLTPHLEMYL